MTKNKISFPLVVVIAGFLMFNQIPSYASTATIQWVAKEGVQVNGNNLKKIASTGWGNAGAVSNKAFNGDGGVSFTANETNTFRMIGLSKFGSADSNYLTIDYAIYPTANGILLIYENGNYIGTFGTYASGDTFKVERKGADIKYYRNANLIYTSATLTQVPLVADAALYSYNSTLNNVVFVTKANTEFTENHEITWKDLVGVSVGVNNTLIKTATTGWANAGSASTKTIDADGGVYILLQQRLQPIEC